MIGEINLLTDKLTKNKVLNRIKELRGKYLREEKSTYNFMMKEHKEYLKTGKGRGIFKPTEVKEQVLNRTECDSEYNELKIWLRGYEYHKKTSESRGRVT